MNKSPRPGPEDWHQIIDGERPSGLTLAANLILIVDPARRSGFLSQRMAVYFAFNISFSSGAMAYFWEYLRRAIAQLPSVR